MQETIVIDDITLSYIEKNPKMPQTIIFIHGNSSSANTWDSQLSDPAFNKYRLIAIDLPAHGSSSDDPYQRYSVVQIGRLMSAAVNQLTKGIDFVLVGVSLGSNIATEMLDLIQPKGIVIAGPTIIGDHLTFQDIFRKETDTHTLFTDEYIEDDVTDFFLKAIFNAEKHITKNLTNDYINVKPPFRSILIKTASNGEISNELELIRKANLNPLVIFGNEDEIVNTDYLNNANISFWNNHPIRIKSAGHFIHLDQPLLFNKVLQEYLSSCFTKF